MTRSLQTTIACLILLVGSLLNAQSAEEHVRSMFANKGNVEWVREMDGTVNSLHPMHMTLGYDGRAYRGLVRYAHIPVDFEVVGTARDGVLTLQELDGEGNVTGGIRGVLKRDRFNGSWWSSDITRSADVDLMDKGLILLDQFEPRFVVLDGEAGRESMNCLLSIESPNVISGTWQRGDECVRLLGECTDFLCNTMELMVTEGEMRGAVLICKKQGGNYNVSVRNAGAPANGTVETKASYELYKLAGGGFSYLVDLAYPVIPEGGFDKWLAAKMDRWYKNVESEIDHDNERSASNRWRESASAWVDIFLLKDELISGLITFYNPDSGNYDRESFIYDTGSRSEVPLDEFDKRPGSLLSAIRSHVETADRASGDYKYVMLSGKGFVISTDFDSVRGDASYCVSYTELEQHLKKRATLAKLEN